MAIYIPLLAVLLTALLGVITYSVQKAFDRRNELIKLRQSEYKKFIEVFQRNICESGVEN